MNHIKTLLQRYPQLQPVGKSIEAACRTLAHSARNGKILICGNGGSAADSEHMAGELMKGFVLPRPLPAKEKQSFALSFGEEGRFIADNLELAIRAIPLTGMPSLATAFANDRDPALGFAQQVYALADPQDTLLAISTSGNSKNVIYAAMTAKRKKAAVVALTGRRKSKLSQIADVAVCVPEQEAYKVQELHLPVYHALCLQLEERLVHGWEA